MNTELPENVTVKSESILAFGVVGIAFILWLVKFAFPEGMMDGWHGYESLEKPAKNCFSKNTFQTEYRRIIGHKQRTVYFNKTIDIYYDNEKILSYSYNDPSKPEAIEYFKLKNEGIEGLIQEDTAIVYTTSDGKTQYCVLDGKQSSGYDKSIYERALGCI